MRGAFCFWLGIAFSAVFLIVLTVGIILAERGRDDGDVIMVSGIPAIAAILAFFAM